MTSVTPALTLFPASAGPGFRLGHRNGAWICEKPVKVVNSSIVAFCSAKAACACTAQIWKYTVSNYGATFAERKATLMARPRLGYNSDSRGTRL